MRPQDYPDDAQLRVAYFEGAPIGPAWTGRWVIRRARPSSPPAEARRRVLEVLLVGVHESDGLVAVASAYLQRNPQLEMHFWYCRAFVASANRMGKVAVQLASRDGTCSWSGTSPGRTPAAPESSTRSRTRA